ncbi:hypothetical protein UFOVP232_2 [uncultured Caudovirales phage]|uniref:Uncharacterized protein n=1 Tax=uncultured Caudovirales phage TaxID=2100421 RepID=A0A6J7WQ67_9CAUD|nr:hypothetical protein UFOVP232_2 [uncultured Caudovirales phage]
MSGDHNMYASGSGDGQRFGWRKRTIMEMAREAGLCTWLKPPEYFVERIERFAELVRADEAEKFKWDIHSCGPTCTKIGCVAVREAVKAEREACAKVCDAFQARDVGMQPAECAAAIRARGQA